MNDLRFLTRREAVILALLALALLLWLVFPKSAGERVIVTVSGEELGVYPLNEPAQVPINGVNGLTNLLVIEKGQARVEAANCPDLLCQRHSPISKAGESIVCLPGQIVISVEGGSGHGPDAVSG